MALKIADPSLNFVEHLGVYSRITRPELATIFNSLGNDRYINVQDEMRIRLQRFG